MFTNGIDISTHQGASDVNAGGWDFVIARASYGPSQKDGRYDNYIQQLRDSGRNRGSYHFATGDRSGWEEADFYMQCANRQPGELMVLDMEREVEFQKGIIKIATYQDVPTWALEFLRRCREATGHTGGIYMSGSVTREFDWSPLINEGFWLWTAHWGTDNPMVGGWPFWAVHQTSSSGSGPGFSGRLDTNRFNGDQDTWNAYAGSSGGVTPPFPGSPAPGEAPAIDPTPVNTGAVYIVSSGDTLSGIAMAHGLSLDAIRSLNPQIKNPNLIYPGDHINVGVENSPVAPPAVEIPSGEHTYTVEPGDGMIAIANKLGVDYQEFVRINPQVANVNRIFVGQVLNVPGGDPVAQAPVGPALTFRYEDYTVQPGDSLTAIAQRYPDADITADSIAAENGIANANLIWPGQVIHIG